MSIFILEKEFDRFRRNSPIVVIPDDNLQIYSRCLLVRMDPAGIIEDIQDDDLDKIRPFLCDMQLPKQETTS